jgi:hypothetical protein
MKLAGIIIGLMLAFDQYDMHVEQGSLAICQH